MTFKIGPISLTLGNRISRQFAFSLCPFAYINGIKEKYVWAHFQVFYWHFNIKIFIKSRATNNEEKYEQ